MLIGRGGRTYVSLTVSGVPDDISRPVHLYTYVYRGSCGRLQETPEHAMNDHVLADVSWPTASRNGPYTVRNTVAVSLEQLRAMPHAIVVRSSPADGARELFCGNVG
jgi:hypothetical protein